MKEKDIITAIKNVKSKKEAKSIVKQLVDMPGKTENNKAAFILLVADCLRSLDTAFQLQENSVYYQGK